MERSLLLNWSQRYGRVHDTCKTEEFCTKWKAIGFDTSPAPVPDRRHFTTILCGLKALFLIYNPWVQQSKLL